MPDPVSHPWLSPELVQSHTGDDGPAVEAARVAAGAYVERMRPDLWVGVDAPDADPPTARTFTPGDDVVHGSVLLVARLLARKSSPAGLASFGEFGAAPVVNLDRDVERLLGLGRYAAPRVG